MNSPKTLFVHNKEEFETNLSKAESQLELLSEGFFSEGQYYHHRSSNFYSRIFIACSISFLIRGWLSIKFLPAILPIKWLRNDKQRLPEQKNAKQHGCKGIFSTGKRQRPKCKVPLQ